MHIRQRSPPDTEEIPTYVVVLTGFWYILCTQCCQVPSTFHYAVSVLLIALLVLPVPAPYALFTSFPTNGRVSRFASSKISRSSSSSPSPCSARLIIVVVSSVVLRRRETSDGDAAPYSHSASRAGGNVAGAVTSGCRFACEPAPCGMSSSSAGGGSCQGDRGRESGTRSFRISDFRLRKESFVSKAHGPVANSK
ncbi:hypothetical protein K439DRAFT_920267 [Ramaria rubella]|nr:hypothetical protein K439DRAFT_920267 [Ramaria rubella]